MTKLSAVAFKFVENKEEDEILSKRMKLLSFITPEVGLPALAHKLQVDYYCAFLVNIAGS